MSTKRTRTASAAEPSSSPKKRATVESSEPNKIVTRGKRKLLDVDDEVIEKLKKSPKKASLVVAAVTRRSSKKIAIDEAEETSNMPQKEVKKATVKATIDESEETSNMPQKEVKKATVKATIDEAEETSNILQKAVKKATVKATIDESEETSNIPQKAVKKETVKATIDEAEETSSVPQKAVKKATVKATKVDSATAHLAGNDEIKKIARPKSVRVLKSVAVPVVVPLSPIPVVTHRVSSPASTSTMTAPNRQDARKFYVAPEVDRSNGNEISSLAEQYWSTLSHCFSTIGPLFLFLVLVLYAVSALTGSQAIASIGLVYVFTFLIIMGTFYCATLPFIIVSNTVSRLIFPNGTSNQRDLTRVAFLMLTIGVAFTLFQYGDTFFSETK